MKAIILSISSDIGKALSITLKERGYDTSDYEERSISEIQKMYNEKQLDMLMNKEDTSDDRKIFIKYHLTGKIRINQIYEYIDDLYNVEEILTKKDCAVLRLFVKWFWFS